MTMRIVFLRDFDGYKADEDCYVERALARRICRQRAAIPYVTLMKQKEEQEFYAREAKKKADDLKRIADAAKRKEAAEKKAAEAAAKKAADDAAKKYIADKKKTQAAEKKAKAEKLLKDKSGSGREKATRG